MKAEIQPEPLRKFAEVTGSIMNSELQAWKDQGGGVVGFFCSTVPEEILTASGLLPFRMRGTGSTSTELSDAYFSSINCSFPRHTFNQALRGEYDFLDGLICINSCDHVRRIYDNWTRALKTPFVQVMSLPRKVGEPQIQWYYDELHILRGQLEEHFGIQLTDHCIREAIQLQNEIRDLQKQLYLLRKADKPPITGAESLAVMVAGTAMPKQRYKELLTELLDELRGKEGSRDYRARLMILGGELDDPAYVEIIEEQGGLVVTDSTCFGSRLMWAPVDEAEPDPIRALASYYIHDRPSCPRMYGHQPQRIAYTKELAKEFRVDGIIGERLLFCDQWVVENYMTGLDLEEAGIPFMALDREYVLSGEGQLRTRVQAFLETLEARRELENG